MTPEELADALRHAVVDAVGAGELPDVSDRTLALSLADAPVRPAARGWSTPVALRLSAATGMPAGAVAGVLADRIARLDTVETVSVRDGFLEVVPRSSAAVLERAAAEGEAYGRGLPGTVAPPARWVRAARQPRTVDNPVFLVQLARARLVRLVDLAEDHTSPVAEVPAHPQLVSAVAQFAGVVDRAVRANDGEGLARFLERLAAQVLTSAVTDEAPGRGLVTALAIVLTNGLRTLGVATPNRI